MVESLIILLQMQLMFVEVCTRDYKKTLSVWIKRGLFCCLSIIFKPKKLEIKLYYQQHKNVNNKLFGHYYIVKYKT